MPPATTSAQALQNLQGFQVENPDQALTKAQGQLGVQGAQQQVTGLRAAINNTTNLLNQVAPSVYGRTGNSLVTDAQATRQIGNEQAPLNTQLNKENQDYGTASSDYNELERQAEARANANLTGEQTQRSYLQNVYDTLYKQEQDAKAQAEATRQFNVDQANQMSRARASGSGGASPSFGGSGGQAAVGTLGRDASGGYKITGPTGQPITMGQYAAMNGLNINWIAQQLMQSGNPNDQKIAATINSNKYTSTQLRQMFPQALGGSY